MTAKPRRWLIPLALGLLSGMGCRKDPATAVEQPPASTPMKEGPTAATGPVKVWVAQDGAIELNGVAATLADVERAFESAATTGAVVFYGRDAASDEPHPNGMKVIELVTRYGLPVRLSTKRDFSDAVDASGTSVR